MTTRTTTIEIRNLNEAILRMMACARDREAGRKAREEMNRTREEIRRRMGTLDVAVELVRDARNP